jgi:N-methylhydantoinase A
MAAYMARLGERLTEAGFAGRTLVVTSQAGVIDATEAARTPIHLLNSGPSMAPVAGRHFSMLDASADTAIIADTGGTTYDVSLVRRGRIPWTRETWIGPPFRGHMTGFPSVDVRSVGAGGGSIAWVDDGGMLHVGPRSAGAVPGPACYGTGGSAPTVTDAAIVLGYLDANFFLGGRMKLDPRLARAVIEEQVARPLGLSVAEGAAAVLSVTTENMVQAIMDITVNQGIDPRGAVLVGGGGAAGLNSVPIARRLESPRLLIPEVGAALSAAGAMMSDLTSQFHATLFAKSDAFEYERVNAVLDALEGRCREFMRGPGHGSLEQRVQFWAEARYPEQVWEIEVPLPCARFRGPADVKALVEAFHLAHEEVFAIRDEGSAVEVVGWSATVACRIRARESGSLTATEVTGSIEGERKAYFPTRGYVDAAVRRFETMAPGERLPGRAIVESSFTTVVIHPGATAERRPSGSLSIDPGRE